MYKKVCSVSSKKRLSQITAAILAGGFGTRLQAVVSDRPKALVQINGRPFLAYLLDQLVRAGINHAVLCTGYLADQIQDTFGSVYGSLSLSYSVETSPLGTAGALKNADKYLGSDPVMVVNGDSYCEVDMGVFYDWHERIHSAGSLVLVKVAEANRYGCVQSDPDYRITGFDEKGTENRFAWINAGIYLLKKALIQSIPGGKAVSLEREMFPQWLLQGHLFGYPYQGIFIDIGVPDDLARVKTLIHRGDLHESSSV
jgi:D-glycero-alpha-D-manno-heptose 1-phosphate guanylyltransferase